MYAVIKTGGKQYKVAADDVISVEKLAAAPGDSIAFDQVLMIADGKTATLGAPVIEGASVSATVIEQKRGAKIIVFKKKRRKGYRRKHGHRQDLTVLRITGIEAKGGARPAAAAKAEKKPAATAKAKPAAEKKPARKTAAKPAAKKTAAKEKK